MKTKKDVSNKSVLLAFNLGNSQPKKLFQGGKIEVYKPKGVKK